MTEHRSSKTKNGSDFWLVAATVVYVAFVTGAGAFSVWIIWRAASHG